MYGALRFLPFLIITLCLGPSSLGQMDRITLISSETLECKVLDRTEREITLDHALLGKLKIPAKSVAEVVIASDVKPPSTEQTVKETAVPMEGPPEEPAPMDADTPETERPFPLSLFTGWDSRFEFGLSGSVGNSDTAKLRVGLTTKREDEAQRTNTRATFDYSTDGGTTTRNQLNFELTHDWLIPDEPWFTYVQGIYDFDEFKPWDHRVSGFGGFGYRFLNNDRIELDGRVGGGATKEFGGAKELRPEGLISAGLIRYKLSKNQSLTGSSTFFPDIGEPGKFRVVSKIEWTTNIDNANGMSLRLAIENEYESVTNGDADHSDIKYIGSLVFDF